MYESIFLFFYVDDFEAIPKQGCNRSHNFLLIN